MKALSGTARSMLYATLRRLFRTLPISLDTRDRWRSAFMERLPNLAPASQRGRAARASGSRRPLVKSDTPAIGHVAYKSAPLPASLPATLVAFYLPQFHAFAENDQWWGKGFTEWRNVTRALPQFEGHLQPRLPADLGFYDLRNVEVMRQQALLASEYGIGAFCFYFYWFGGKTLMEQPLRQWLADEQIELPFCLCWANENWTRRWDGREQDVLIAQSHSAADDLEFISHVAEYLRDPRYLRVDGKPMLLVYRPHRLPDAKATAERWRHWCREHGIGEIHLAYVQGFERPDPVTIGFDAAVEFPPNMSTAPSITSRQILVNNDYSGSVLDWRDLAREMPKNPLPAHRLYPGVNPGWDNEARRPGRGQVLLHASPRAYGDWLRDTIHQRLASTPQSGRFVFINAWNEWAEGAVLEPDLRLGHAWLEQTRRALQPPVQSASLRIAVVVHAWYTEALPDILARLRRWRHTPRLVVTTTTELAGSVSKMLAEHPFEHELRIHPNRGRDVLPFLHEADRLCNEGFDLLLKLHTKRSVHRHDGEHWAKELLDQLLPMDAPDACIETFLGSPETGMLAPAGHLLPMEDYLGDNADNLDFLAARLGLETRGKHLRFAAGTMFWARTAALRPVLDAHMSPDDFDPELGQIDGTLAHALERTFGTAAEYAGYKVAETGNASTSALPHYRYARPSR